MSARIVLVAPKFEGNVGAIARSMANFSLDELFLVNPCDIGDEALSRSKHGKHILENATAVDSLGEALEGCFLVAGTSGIIAGGDKNYVRAPISARELASRLQDYDEKVAILFGREDQGLFQDELSKCDVLVTIPADGEYPVLNISHAAAIVMYEVFQTSSRLKKPREADEVEKAMLFQRFDELLDELDYPEHRRQRTSVMFRRMMGRAVPTKWEFYTIMGIIGDAAARLRGKD